ncbi:restriction endonuclease subunit S [Shewanella sp. SW32]|uniref:restriction endonuclease subunit S n=1 Tax=unclassified Shewanella TaxID=196818 RepID=UPI0021D87B29|nr:MULTISPECIES: restriction endonuclease subunit S [unclassified Shewanella]MCU7965186.1 restriction endonuclease subunit S [Shewanella sp. SW32]MCU7973176.1 restriction endonuclease subunit S [Shewanella sp. SW29]
MADSSIPNAHARNIESAPTAENLITTHLDIWTTAIEQKSSAGRGSSKKFSLYGIKKLRELILELAVRGKLVPQDANDEPASLLLERIAAEKAQLVKDGKLKKQKPLPEIGEDEKPFELSNGWIWCRVIDIAGYINGFAFKSSSFQDTGVGIVKIGDISSTGELTPDSMSRVEKSVIKNLDPNLRVEAGDLVIAMSGATTGKLGFNKSNEVFYLNQRVGKFVPYQMNIYYLYLLLTTKIEENLDKSTGSAIPNLSTGQINEIVIALPPLEEQHRIVAKVDELMSLCDALEAQTEASISAHQTLVEILLNALLLPQATANTASQSDVSLEPQPFTDSFDKDWQRVAEHFDTLFTTSASIDTLKQTILQLAVMGKLVKQDPNDEPAAKLLERIAKEKAQLIKEGKIKKQKLLPAITEEEKSFELPQGWEWIRLEDLVDIQGGITKGRKLIGRELITVKYLSVANVQRSYLDLGHLKEIEIPVEEEDKYRVKARDLLITEGGDWDKVGRTAIWSNELPYIAHQNHVFKARIFLEEQSEVWLEKYLNGPFARDYFAGSSKQTTNLASINKTQLRGCLIAIPPNEEKDRIVTKVDELMALCDQLKARLADAQTTQLHLTDAIVEQAI